MVYETFLLSSLRFNGFAICCEEINNALPQYGKEIIVFGMRGTGINPDSIIGRPSDLEQINFPLPGFLICKMKMIQTSASYCVKQTK